MKNIFTFKAASLAVFMLMIWGGQTHGQTLPLIDGYGMVDKGTTATASYDYDMNKRASELNVFDDLGDGIINTTISQMVDKEVFVVLYNTMGITLTSKLNVDAGQIQVDTAKQAIKPGVYRIKASSDQDFYNKLLVVN